MKTYIPAAAHLFFTKNDPHDIRLGDIFKPTENLQELQDSNAYALLGYPDDEGIKLNGGRIGAALGPSSIRQFFYKMTPASSELKSYFDIGDLSVSSALETRHALAQETILKLQQKNIKTLSFGGGHDYGYSDASGFLKAHLGKKHKPVVLNFDAHLDVRPTTKGFNSGTPFYRLLSEFENQFEFAEIGIQPQCNSLFHREWAAQKKAQIFNLHDIQSQSTGLSSLLNHSFFSKLTPETPLFISFDIDCLSSTEAHGCSQSWVTGLHTQDYLNFFHRLKTISDIRGLGIYEVSPPLDTDNQTSKTAALIAYNFLFQDSL